MKTSDIKELHQLDVKELDQKATDLREQIDKAQMENVAGKLKNVRLISTLSKDLARVLTIRQEKQLLQTKE